MANTFENIFREVAKALGQIACQKLLNEIFKEEEVVKPTKAVAAKTVDAAPAEVRWTRWTKTYTDAFKKALTDVTQDEKELDKLKKEFVKYLNDLTEEDYKKDTKTHVDRMNDFAALKAPKKEPVPVTKVETDAPAAAGSGKPTKAKKKTMWEEMNSHETPSAPPSNAAHFHDVKDIEELQNNELLVTVEGSPEGVFWDGKNGRWVRGPPEVQDEDLVEQTFNKLVYEIGEESGRIYRFNEEKDRHEFVGYVGVGKFHDMRMP